MTIKTNRLELIQFTTDHIIALRSGSVAFQKLVGYPWAEGLEAVAEGYSKMFEKVTLPPDEWLLGFQVILPAEQKVIGCCGYKGPPDENGMVEIAYVTAPAYRGNGYATEAAQALIRYAFESRAITIVRAHTLPEPNASTRILAKCGLRNIGEVIDPEDGRIWRWEITQAQWRSNFRDCA
jgi:ribosomal-protein-alanine N-acetyltransferase